MNIQRTTWQFTAPEMEGVMCEGTFHRGKQSVPCRVVKWGLQQFPRGGGALIASGHKADVYLIDGDLEIAVECNQLDDPGVARNIEYVLIRFFGL